MAEKPMDSALVEKYQLMLEKDPNSMVFAPLVDAYRKMGLIDQAAEEGIKGVRLHPNFASGRIALARVLIERIQFEDAVKQLEFAVKLSPENIMAFQLLADCLVKLKQPKQALKAYKMVMFLNPKDEKTQSAVKRLESVTADEFEEELFQMLPLNPLSHETGDLSLSPINENNESLQMGSQVDRAVSLIDAFIVRNDFDRAVEILDQAEPYLPDSAELIKRRKLLNQLAEFEEASEAESSRETASAMNRKKALHEKKVKKLKVLLARISDRSIDRSSTK